MRQNDDSAINRFMANGINTFAAIQIFLLGSGCVCLRVGVGSPRFVFRLKRLVKHG